MPNIFDGLRKISDKDMIEQIALIETMNITNISKPIVQKAKKKTISIINFIGSKIGRNRMIEEPEVKEIWSLIDENKDGLKNCTRADLDKRLLDILLEKSKSDMKNLTEDALSIEIIEEGAKLYKIYNNLTPAQKADKIYFKYCEKLEGKAKEYLNDQPFIDLQETTEDIEEILNNMDDQQKKEFAQSVEVEEMTFLNIWKKVDRQHYARLVWLSVKAYEGRFTPKEEMLPSFVNNENQAKVMKIDEDLKASQEELKELKNKIELCKDKINSIENNLQKENRLLNNAIRDKNQAEEDVIKLGKMYVKLEVVKKSQEDELEEIKEHMKNAELEKLDLLMEEFKKVKFDAIDINNKISDINIEGTYKSQLIEDNTLVISSKEKAIIEIGNEFKQIKIDAEKLVEYYNEKEKEVYKKEESKRHEIFERWSRFFNKFTFEYKELGAIVNFSRKELLHIEECLYELHFTKDPIGISMGLIESNGNKKEKDEFQYIDAGFSDKFEVEIHYKVLNNEEKNVSIVGITTEF